MTHGCGLVRNWSCGRIQLQRSAVQIPSQMSFFILLPFFEPGEMEKKSKVFRFLSDSSYTKISVVFPGYWPKYVLKTMIQSRQRSCHVIVLWHGTNFSPASFRRDWFVLGHHCPSLRTRTSRRSSIQIWRQIRIQIWRENWIQIVKLIADRSTQRVDSLVSRNLKYKVTIGVVTSTRRQGVDDLTYSFQRLSTSDLMQQGVWLDTFNINIC